MRSNNGDTCRAAALAGCGIILQPTFMIAEDLEHGDLVEILRQYKGIELGLYAVYPSRKFLAAKVRALVDFIAKKLGSNTPAATRVPTKRRRR